MLIHYVSTILYWKLERIKRMIQSKIIVSNKCKVTFIISRYLTDIYKLYI